ncbi:hypothetical protein FOQG_15382 [Fusarium oxysporum f. sp. raphani 54005]|uniref:Uncharacterized protein n=1 Tax=Fusarium oxysporum f. sp. raphani 54005 TaxID=1089458 RepID=X0BM99_FUSOX|nr:hypothetical protein FOQG_15382 [Fusarium oxysporum f. sp. raphani 54005]
MVRLLGLRIFSRLLLATLTASSAPVSLSVPSIS